MIGTTQLDPAAGIAPPSVSTAIVRRNTYPRVPPEVLLRDYAAKFHLSGLTLSSLLSAMNPVTSLAVPLFVSRTDTGCGPSSTFIDTLLRDAPRRPPVPLDNIKQFNPGAAHLERELHKQEDEQDYEKSSFNPREAMKTFKFDEAMPSRISAAVIIHGSAPLDEREALWGYDTGAVMHVRLQVFAADLIFLSRRDYLATRAAGPREPGAKAARAAAKAKAAAKRASANGGAAGSSRGPDVSTSDPHDSVKGERKGPRGSEAYNASGRSGRKSGEHGPDEKQDDTDTDDTDDTDSDDTDERDESDDAGMDNDFPEDEEEGDVKEAEFTRRTPRGVSLLGFHLIGGVTCLAFDTHTSLAISGGADGTILAWDTYNRYRSAGRDRYGRDDDSRHTRATEQFATHMRTRRLAQRLTRAHDGAISAIATHCELLITGGADGVVRVWSCGNGSAAPVAGGPPPQYAEQQSFRCGTWVRHIWCAAERSAQGDGVLVTDDTGAITALRGCTLAQPPPVPAAATKQQKSAREAPGLPWDDQARWKQYFERTPTLMDAIRTRSPLMGIMQPMVEMRRGGVSQETQKRRVGGPGVSKMNGAHTNASVAGSKNGGNEWALALLMRGAVTRVLVVSRVLRIHSEESRLAGTPLVSGGGGAGMPLSAALGSTSAITRLIPLLERNLMITLGYSPIVRLIDMTRLVCVSVVEHPDLTAAGKSQSALSSESGHSHLGGYSGNNTQQMNHMANTRTGMGETLRFIDVIYISSFDYLILLDNRDTVFVWDGATSKVLATWRPPQRHRSQRATGLLTCGTRHYRTAHSASAHRRSTMPPGPLAYATDGLGTRGVDRVLGITRVPFFIICAGGLELCEVVVAAHARVEVRGHEDTVVGLGVLYVKDKMENHRRGEEIRRILQLMKEKRKQQQRDSPLLESTYSMNPTAAQLRSTASSRQGTPDQRDDANGDEEMGEDVYNETVAWLQEKLYTTDSGMMRVLSCCADGTIRFWTSTLKPLNVYNPTQLSDEDNRFDTVANVLPSMRAESLASSFTSAPPSRRSRRESRKSSDSTDVTSFHYSAVWNLAATGHDDGSIRLWPCDQLTATCTWHRDLHRNAISGITECRIRLIKDSTSGRTVMKTDETSNNTLGLLLTVSYDGHLAAWANPQHRKTILHGRVRVSRSELLCVAFEAMNELVVVGDNAGVVSTWGVRDFQQRRAIPSRSPSPWRPTVTTAFPQSIMVSRERAPAVGAAKSMTLYSSIRNNNNNKSTNKDTLVKRRIGHTEAVTALLVDGHLVFSGGEDGRVLLWDLHLGILIREYFLLHDSELILQHKRMVGQKSVDPYFAMSSTAFGYSKLCNPPSTVMINQGEMFQPPPREDVASIVLLKERNGDFIVGTREGWLYHFQQKDPYPHYTFKHASPVRALCVMSEGREWSDELVGIGSSIPNVDPIVFSKFKEDCDFEIGIGGEDGTIAAVRESYFASLI